MGRSLARTVLFVMVGTAGTSVPLRAGANRAAQQDASALEIASIKRADRGTTQSVKISPNGTLMMTASPTFELVKAAYPEIPYNNVVGLPEWTRSERYNITAKPPDSVTHASAGQQIAMLRALLSDRYKLSVHTESRLTPVFNLVRARRDGRLGPNLRQSEQNCSWPSPLPDERPCRGSFSSGIWGEMPMALFVEVIQGFVGRVVIDKTALSGTYQVDLKLDFRDISFIFTAIQEQLGLKLDRATSMVDFLVIDHIERPSED
jgi:uncharacterized protein (TIGR03435 family)